MPSVPSWIPNSTNPPPPAPIASKIAAITPSSPFWEKTRSSEAVRSGAAAPALRELAERRIDGARAVGVLERALHQRAEGARIGGVADAVDEAHRRAPFHIAAASSPSAVSRLTIQPSRQLHGS